MSFWYKILNIPHTVEDFADHVKRRGYREVMIDAEVIRPHEETLTIDPYSSTPFMHHPNGNYRSVILIEADALTFVAEDKAYTKNQETHPVKAYERETLTKALDIAERLTTCGLTALVNGYSLDEARHILNTLSTPEPEEPKVTLTFKMPP